jgi:hypothetical protein
VFGVLPEISGELRWRNALTLVTADYLVLLAVNAKIYPVSGTAPLVLLYPLAIAAGRLLFPGCHAIYREWTHQGTGSSIVPALACAEGGGRGDAPSIGKSRCGRSVQRTARAS